MIKEAFLNYIKNPTSFSLQDKLEIQAEKAAYPYCSLLQMLDILSDKASNMYDWENRFLPVVNTYMLNRCLLKQKLDAVEEISLQTTEQIHLKELIEKKKEKVAVVKKESDKDIFQEINAYHEVSFRTAPKDVIVGQFLDSQSMIPSTDDNEVIGIEQLEKKSVTINLKFASETLASVFEKQKNFMKAIEIYEQLSLKYPEKSTTFASHIERLKQLIKE